MMDAHNIPAMIIRYACTTSVIYHSLTASVSLSRNCADPLVFDCRDGTNIKCKSLPRFGPPICLHVATYVADIMTVVHYTIIQLYIVHDFVHYIRCIIKRLTLI